MDSVPLYEIGERSMKMQECSTTKMPLSKIVFGKTDAFNELNAFGQEYFVGSFVSNPRYHIDDFFSGSRFFICGKKGTGKSTLLKLRNYFSVQYRG